jgi:putative transcription factor
MSYSSEEFTIVLKKTSKQIQEDPYLRNKASTSINQTQPQERKIHNPEGAHAYKISEYNDAGTIPTVSMDVSKAIQKGRADKGFTQKDLAGKINEKPAIINEYESGKAIPNAQVLGKMERILGIKLRGKDIGTPLRKN